MTGQTCSKSSAGSWCRENVVLLITIVAIVLGVIFGISLRQAHLSYDAILWIKLWGELFMRMLKLIILPMVMACLIVGLSNLEGKAVGKLGGLTLLWVFGTQVIGVVLGFALAFTIHPGSQLGGEVHLEDTTTSYTDLFGDFLRNLFPDNIIQACLQNAHTIRKTENISVTTDDGNSTEYRTQVTTKLQYRDGMNTIGVVVFSLLIGFGIQAGGERARPLAELFDAFNIVIFKIMGFILWYSPIGILSLIMGALLQVDDLEGALSAMALYVLTVLVGLALHQFLILPLIYFVIVRKNPFKIILHVIDAMMAGMAASSSAVGLPYLLRDSEEMDVDSRIANFCMPIFVQINRDGSVLFATVALTFIAQTYGITLSVTQVLLAGLLITMLSVTFVAVPSSSVLVIIMIAGVLNVPVTDRLGLIMAVEWLLDRLRTFTNLQSNGFGASILHHLCAKDLDRISPPEEEMKDAIKSERESDNDKENSELNELLHPSA